MEDFSTATIFERLLSIEKEIADLRRVLLKSHGSELAAKNPGSLRGVWQGVSIDEEDFAEAKTALFTPLQSYTTRLL